MHRLDDQYPRAWFGLEYLLVRIREEICRPAIPELIKHLKGYLFRLKRHKQESMSAWALRGEKVYHQLTRALTRLERTAEATEPDWAMLYVGRQTRIGGTACEVSDGTMSFPGRHNMTRKRRTHRTGSCARGRNCKAARDGSKSTHSSQWSADQRCPSRRHSGLALAADVGTLRVQQEDHARKHSEHAKTDEARSSPETTVA